MSATTLQVGSTPEGRIVLTWTTPTSYGNSVTKLEMDATAARWLAAKLTAEADFVERLRPPGPAAGEPGG